MEKLIFYLLLYGLCFGSNLSGDERVCLANENKDDYYVELHFSDNNGTNHTILRSKSRTDNSKNILFLDGTIAKQEDLVNFYFNKGLFLSVINLAYFTGLQPAKQKELVDKYLPNVDVAEVYNQLSDNEKKILTAPPMNAKLHITELDSELKSLNSNIENLQGKIDYAFNIANQELTLPPIFFKQEELDLAKQELDQLKSDKKLIDRNELIKQLSDLKHEEFELGTDIAKLDKELSEGKLQYQKLLNTPDCPCPTCKQILTNDSKVIATKNFRNELIEKNDKRTKLKERYNKKHFERVACEGKIFALDNDNIANVSLDNIRKIEENIKMLEDEKIENAKLQAAYSISCNSKEKATSDIQNFKSEISLLQKDILNIKEEIEITKKLYFNLLKAKMSVADKYLKDVKIKFYKIIKSTGEIKDDFIITYKNKDYSTLSRSEKIATSLEIANMLNKITLLDCPLFIDDNESYPDFDFITKYSDTQIFIAQVQKGQELLITNENTNQFIEPQKIPCVA